MASERFLLIRLSSLGDVVLTEPVVRALRSKYPGATIDLLTDARYATLGREFFGVDAVTAYDRRGADRGWSGLGRVIERLPSKHYTAVIDLQNKVRTRMLARRLDAPQKLVLKKRSFVQGTLAVLGHDPPIDDRHQVDVYLSLLSKLGIDPPRDPRARGKRPEPLFSRSRPDDGIWIGMSPGATHATKRWPIARFLDLARSLTERVPRVRFVPIGGHADRDQIDAIKSGDGLALAGGDTADLDVGGLLRAIASLDLLISVDTGPAHLAAAIGVPVVVLFGPTSSVRWGPRGAEHRAVSLNLSCAPCSNTGQEVCPLSSRSHACMEDLGVQVVLDAALTVLGTVPGSSV
jgi:ADP-heptose:LPS heptosyltransferase